MREVIAAFIPGVFLYVYLILSSIEYGAAFFNLFPKILKNDSLIKTYLNPIWETTNVFLVFSFVAIFTFFPNAVDPLGKGLLVILLSALVTLGIRNLCAIYIFYGDLNNKFINLLYFLASFLTPLIFSGAFIYLVSGKTNTIYFTPLHIMLSVVITSAILLISSSFFSFFSRGKEPNKNLDHTIGFSAAAFVLSSLVFLFLVSKEFTYLIPSSKNLYTLAVVWDIILIAFIVAYWLKKALWIFLNACGLVASVFFYLFIAHLPYIIYPEQTIYNTFTDYTTFNYLIGAFVIGMTLVIPSLAYLFYLFIFKTPNVPKPKL